MKKYRVTLTKSEQEELKSMISKGLYKNTKLKRAQILLGSNQSEQGKNMTDEQISKAYDVSIRTVERTRERFVEKGYQIALNGEPRPLSLPTKMDGELEAHLVAIACSESPEGYEKWTVKLLTEELISKGYVASISQETVRKTLKKTTLNHGKKNTM